jgi:hypothetical protein
MPHFKSDRPFIGLAGCWFSGALSVEDGFIEILISWHCANACRMLHMFGGNRLCIPPFSAGTRV